MTDEQMKKLLEEDTGEVPERFHQAILAAFGQIEDEPFDGTELPISVEAAEKPRRPRHVPRQGGRFRRMLNEQEITAFDHAPVGWWTDNLWLNGQNVDMPGLSGGETWAGDENGEIVVSEMYRLDQVGVFLSGDVQIDLPIGEKQHYDYEMWQSMLKEDGTFRKPDAGLVSFTLNCDAPVTHYADGERVILPDGTAAWVESADDTPVKLYVTVRFEISDAQREAFRAENGEGYVFPDGTVMPFDDVDMVGSWVYGLTLVDADGKPLRESLGYGEGNWGVGSGVADYVFSHEDAYPEQVYLAPQMGEDSADMAWAIPLPVRK